MTKEEILRNLELLKEKKKALEVEEQFQDTQQHAYKIFLNSSYGALGSKYYSCYDLDNAEAVTKSGQTAIKEMMRYAEEKLSSFHETDIRNFVVAGDTDSVSADSIVGGTGMTIAELFEKFKRRDLLTNGTEVSIPDREVTCDGASGKTIIKNISRRKVNKERWQINIGNKSVITTGDHSIMVCRDSQLIEVKPRDILPTDQLVVRKD